jgi:uncharacterized protein
MAGERARRLLGGGLLAALMITGITSGAAALWLGARLAAPNLHPVGPTAAGATAVVIADAGDAPVAGWLIPGRTDAAVLLMHGSGGDRRSMLARARMLNAAGYTALTIDLPANGESPGRVTTEGYGESRGAQAAVAWLRRQPEVRRVGIIGFSLGGAAALLGPQGPLPVDALVLEAVYPTIEEAVANRIRLRLGPWSGWLHPLFTWQIHPRSGVSPADLRPLERIGAVRCPVLVIGGGADRHTPPDETHRLFAAAPEPKRLWIVPGAVHRDFEAAAPAQYRRQVLDFLDWALTPTAGADTGEGRR